MAQLRLGYPEIARSGAEVLQITHNTAEEAQRYFKHYPIAFPYLCDPGRVVHEAYGLTLQTASVKNVTASAMTTVSDLLRRGEKTPLPLPFVMRYGYKDRRRPSSSSIAMASCDAWSRRGRTPSCPRTRRSCEDSTRSGSASAPELADWRDRLLGRLWFEGGAIVAA